MDRRWTNHLGTCDCGAEVYAAFAGAECLERTAECKCGRPVCLGCQEEHARVCEACDAHVCEQTAVNNGDFWLCLACIRRGAAAERAEVYGLEIA